MFHLGRLLDNSVQYFVKLSITCGCSITYFLQLWVLNSQYIAASDLSFPLEQFPSDELLASAFGLLDIPYVHKTHVLFS